MNEPAQDFAEKVFCTRCHKPVEIHVPAPLQASLVISIWANELGGLCKDCLKLQQEERNNDGTRS